MKYRLAINGYGRVGRSVLRALHERPELQNKLEIIAINELADLNTMAYLTRFDSTHGRFPGQVFHQDNKLFINGQAIEVSHAAEPEVLNWRSKNIDLLLECSGSFKSRAMAERYLDAGPARVLFSQPAESDVDRTIVFGFNHTEMTCDDRIISNGSCTTNCLVPVLKLLHERFGIEEGVTTTIHSAMNDQPVIDAYHHTNLRLTRAAMQAVIPVETQLSKGIDRLFPALKGRMSSIGIRVPTMNVSMIDLTVRLSKCVNPSEINALFHAAANSTEYSAILGYSDEPHASVDFNHDIRSVIIDGTQTQVSNGLMVKLICWFDNEWGFANRMLDTSFTWMERVVNVI